MPPKNRNKKKNRRHNQAQRGRQSNTSVSETEPETSAPVIVKQKGGRTSSPHQEQIKIQPGGIDLNSIKLLRVEDVLERTDVVTFGKLQYCEYEPIECVIAQCVFKSDYKKGVVRYAASSTDYTQYDTLLNLQPHLQQSIDFETVSLPMKRALLHTPTLMELISSCTSLKYQPVLCLYATPTYELDALSFSLFVKSLTPRQYTHVSNIPETVTQHADYHLQLIMEEEEVESAIVVDHIRIEHADLQVIADGKLNSVLHFTQTVELAPLPTSQTELITPYENLISVINLEIHISQLIFVQPVCEQLSLPVITEDGLLQYPTVSRHMNENLLVTTEIRPQRIHAVNSNQVDLGFMEHATPCCTLYDILCNTTLVHAVECDSAAVVCTDDGMMQCIPIEYFQQDVEAVGEIHCVQTESAIVYMTQLEVPMTSCTIQDVFINPTESESTSALCLAEFSIPCTIDFSPMDDPVRIRSAALDQAFATVEDACPPQIAYIRMEPICFMERVEKCRELGIAESIVPCIAMQDDLQSIASVRPTLMEQVNSGLEEDGALDSSHFRVHQLCSHVNTENCSLTDLVTQFVGITLIHEDCEAASEITSTVIGQVELFIVDDTELAQVTVTRRDVFTAPDVFMEGDTSPVTSEKEEPISDGRDGGDTYLVSEDAEVFKDADDESLHEVSLQEFHDAKPSLSAKMTEPVSDGASQDTVKPKSEEPKVADQSSVKEFKYALEFKVTGPSFLSASPEIKETKTSTDPIETIESQSTSGIRNSSVSRAEKFDLIESSPKIDIQDDPPLLSTEVIQGSVFEWVNDEPVILSSRSGISFGEFTSIQELKEEPALSIQEFDQTKDHSHTKLSMNRTLSEQEYVNLDSTMLSDDTKVGDFSSASEMFKNGEIPSAVDQVSGDDRPSLISSTRDATINFERDPTAQLSSAQTNEVHKPEDAQLLHTEKYPDTDQTVHGEVNHVCDGEVDVECRFPVNSDPDRALNSLKEIISPAEHVKQDVSAGQQSTSDLSSSHKVNFNKDEAGQVIEKSPLMQNNEQNINEQSEDRDFRAGVNGGEPPEIAAEPVHGANIEQAKQSVAPSSVELAPLPVNKVRNFLSLDDIMMDDAVSNSHITASPTRVADVEGKKTTDLRAMREVRVNSSDSPLMKVLDKHQSSSVTIEDSRSFVINRKIMPHIAAAQESLVNFGAVELSLSSESTSEESSHRSEQDLDDNPIAVQTDRSSLKSDDSIQLDTTLQRAQSLPQSHSSASQFMSMAQFTSTKSLFDPSNDRWGNIKLGARFFGKTQSLDGERPTVARLSSGDLDLRRHEVNNMQKQRGNHNESGMFNLKCTVM